MFCSVLPFENAIEMICFVQLFSLKTFDSSRRFNPLPFLFKSLLPGQEDCVFFSGHLNLNAKPETGIPYKEKNYNS
jgi:hypothetical protein